MAEGGNGCGARPMAQAVDDASIRRPVTTEKGTATQSPPGDFSEIMHGLSNVLVSILLNAQIMEWKLPSYSQMRRNTHEIQRSAQHAVLLLKRLAAQKAASAASEATIGQSS